MTTLSYTTFPTIFFAYFRSRKAASDPFSGLVLMERDVSDTVNILLKPISNNKLYKEGTFSVEVPLNTKASYLGMYPIKGDDETSSTDLYSVVRKVGIHITLSGTATPVPVLEIPVLSKKFTGILKRNVLIKAITTAVSPGATVEHIPSTETKVATTPVKKVKEIPPVPAAPTKAPKPLKPGDLHPFVAKQLLELAQLKKEMCPITAEEYITGETAAMPCGHLFMKIAITESFKKEPGRCPACRQHGYPTYV
jgi:hypothetical protein